MKIAIIEKGHFEVAYTLVSLFDTNINSVTVFTNEETMHQLSYLLNGKLDRYTWVIQQHESNRNFIGSIFRHINDHQYDLIFFNTIADNFIHYAWRIQNLKKEKVIMTLHDINGFFHYQPSTAIRRIVRYIGKRKLIRAIPWFNVLSETMIPHLRKKLPTTKVIFNLPGSLFYQENFVRKSYQDNEIIRVVIPGSVDIRRRNYWQVFDLLKLAKQRGIPVSITLLGSLKEKNNTKLFSSIRQWMQSNHDLHIYEVPVVNQKEYDRVMNDCHFIWIPLQPTAVVTDGTIEEYGTSICSGNMGDIIRYARPFLAPSFLQMDPALAESCLRYKTIDDIIARLESLSSEIYDQLQDQALKASLNYTREKIINNNPALFH